MGVIAHAEGPDTQEAPEEACLSLGLRGLSKSLGRGSPGDLAVPCCVYACVCGVSIPWHSCMACWDPQCQEGEAEGGGLGIQQHLQGEGAVRPRWERSLGTPGSGEAWLGGSPSPPGLCLLLSWCSVRAILKSSRPAQPGRPVWESRAESGQPLKRPLGSGEWGLWPWVGSLVVEELPAWANAGQSRGRTGACG